MFAFIDESGNTGENLFDKEQPLFTTAALITKSDFDLVFGDSISRIAKEIGQTELHANRLGIGEIEKIAPGLLPILKKADARFFLSRVEKMYLVTTKVVDTIFDSGENFAVPWHIYNIRPLRMMLVFKVAYLLDEKLVFDFWACLMNKKRGDAYRQFVDVCDVLLHRVEALPDQRSRQIVSEAVTWARNNPEAIYLSSNGKLARYGHLPNMVAFTNLLDGLELQSKAWARPVKKIRHDRQMQFEKSLRYWHEIFASASADPLYLPGGERHVLQKVFGSEFIIASAESSPGIQVVDVVLWLFKRALQGDELPYHSFKLMDFVFRRARQHDFSFRGVEMRMNEIFGELTDQPMTDEQLAKGKEMLELFESKRQENMAEYAQKLISIDK